MYSSGLTLGPAAILNQNPFFEMASSEKLPGPGLMIKVLAVEIP
jgi:hypothetical protein